MAKLVHPLFLKPQRNKANDRDTLLNLFNLQRVPDKLDATKKAVLRALKLFCLGLVLQGTTRAATFFSLSSRTTVHFCHEMLKNALISFNLLLHRAGGFFHGVRSLTFGVDLQEIRIMGILQVPEMCLYVIYTL
jgi:hypothetical protein